MKRELRFLMKLEGLEYLVMSTEELRFYNCRRIIEKPMKEMLKKIRLRKLHN
jgi:hypothetical protein